jgi:acyl-CoA synthetase (AMP-forming)/AMP-acid ligase II
VELAERIRTVLSLDPQAEAIEFRGAWRSWGDVAEISSGVEAALDTSGVEHGGAVGMVLRNDPALVAALLGVVLAERCVVTINPHQGDRALHDEIIDLTVPVLVASTDDWQRAELRSAACAVGAAAIEVGFDPGPTARFLAGHDRVGEGHHRSAAPGIAVEMLTSGTTGPPKRIPLSYDAFARTISAAGEHYRTRRESEPTLALRSGVAIVAAPLIHMSGLFRTLLNVCDGRRIALLDRFQVEEWLALVREHRPRAVSLVPTALQMVLDANVDPEDLASIEVVTSGSAALSPDVQEEFETRFGIPVLPSYGATEFAGGVAGWTLELHREWGRSKRGSVGRAQPGRELRVVDADAGDEVPVNVAGRLEVRDRDGQWVRTTDIARIDADAFVWIEGRADDAILRGGFKVFPSEISDVLRRHPAVHDVGVTGIEDARLGAVPVAAVQLSEGSVATEEELVAHLKANLASYKVPAHVRIVDKLPRTPSMKVSQPGVKALFASGSHA